MSGRYSQNAFLWWLHDAISHPITGTFGLLGRLLRSPRLMALGHHIHNATAPNNDAWADYAEAAFRAGCNESSMSRAERLAAKFTRSTAFASDLRRAINAAKEHGRAEVRVTLADAEELLEFLTGDSGSTTGGMLRASRRTPR